MRARQRIDPFARSLALVTLAALLVRVVYVVGFRRDLVVSGDAYYYHYGAILLAHGKGFVAPVQYLVLHVRLEGADHPPLYTLFLALPSVLGLGTTLVHMLWSACLGAATVALVGLLGRRVGGNRVGLVAAAIAAVSPNVWVYDGEVLSETMAIFTATLVLLLAYRAWARPDLRRGVELGAACGLAMLARSELVLLLPALVWPVAVLADRNLAARTRLLRAAAATGAAIVVVAPWVGYNLARFEHPVYLSSQAETTVAGANCDDTYHGAHLALFTNACLDLYPHDVREDESVTAVRLRKGATAYVRAHGGRAVVVALARVGRVIGVYRVRQQVDLDVFLERRERPVVWVGLFAGYATEVLAIAGAIVLRRRRGPPVFPLAVMPAVVLVTVALTYGNDRFRAAAETALAVLAAVALDALVTRLRPGAVDAGRPEATG